MALIPASLVSALFGIASSLSWGAADFTGGLVSRRIAASVMVTLVNVVGAPLAALIAVGLAQPIPAASSLAWGAAAGVAGALALVSFYRALADGTMGTLAPVAGVTGTLIPVVFAAITEGLPRAHQMGGFGLALAGVWFVSRTGDDFKISRSMGLALVAGIGFGCFFILIRQAATPSVMWVLTASKASATATMAIVTLLGRQSWKVTRGSLALSAVAGALDMAGNAFFLFAAEAGRLDIAVVLSSLYPAMTVLLAFVILKERFSASQGWGVVAMLAALPLIVW